MALDSQTRKLFILGGQQDDKPLADLWSYDVDTHAASELVHNIGAVGGPPCFSARAVANPDRGELYVCVTVIEINGIYQIIIVMESGSPRWRESSVRLLSQTAARHAGYIGMQAIGKHQTQRGRRYSLSSTTTKGRHHHD